MKNDVSGIRVNGTRLLEDLEKMKEKTETPGQGVTRFSYGDMDREARAYLIESGQSFGLSIETDSVGNMFFRFPEVQSLIYYALLQQLFPTIFLHFPDL